MALAVSQAVVGYDRVRSGRCSKVSPCRTTEGTSGLGLETDPTNQFVSWRVYAKKDCTGLVIMGRGRGLGVFRNRMDGGFGASQGPRPGQGRERSWTNTEGGRETRREREKRRRREEQKTAQKSSGWKEQTPLRHTYTERDWPVGILYCIGFLGILSNRT
ncbi:hypothetical protein CGRA01v4_11587 [Colletotrichum graminicola]|nr:hypothetical protein CGRA01v4_11587 [Colletotrichum graminicola]